MSNREKIDMLEDILIDAESIYDRKTIEDYDQLINQSAEAEVLDIIGLIKDKIIELNDADEKKGDGGSR